MIGHWHIDDAGRVMPPPPSILPKVDRVLVYYDGPQWLIVSDGEQRYAAYAADEEEDGSVVRWVEAPVSGVEVRALLAGRLPLRDAILKPHCRVIDYAHGRREALRAWALSGADVPDACLPDDDAFLPTASQEKTVLPERTTIAFECDGPAVRNNAILFTVLGEITSSLQRVWTSIGETVGMASEPDGGWDFSTLAFAGSRPGSFAIDATAGNGEAAIEIAKKYRDVVRASYGSPDRLQSAMAVGGPKLRIAFREYLAVLTSRKMDVFADWRQDGAFVGHDCATRAQGAITAFSGEASLRPGDFSVRGHLTGWMTDRKSFEFHDSDTEKTHIGKVSLRVATMWNVRPPTLGKTGTIYAGVVRRKVKDGKPKLHLIQLSECGPDFLSSKKS